MTDPASPSPRDVQDIIQTRMAGEMQPVNPSPEVVTRVTEPDAQTQIATRDGNTTCLPSEHEATTRLPGPPVDPEATRPSTAAASAFAQTRVSTGQPDTGAITKGTTGRFTGSVTRLGRTRTNSSLPHDTQQLDLRLQVSRPSVLADLGRLGPDSIPPGVRKLIDDHGTEGRYAVEKPLAQGGMGAVLLIKDGDFQRPAAMKVMLSRFAQSPEALERFLAEAQVTAQLEHPNIVPIHDLGIMEDGTVYFTMKFIEGESLGGVVKRLKSDDPAVAAKAAEEWSIEHTLLTFLKVLDGMSYAHAKGVVHRDIKPDNIMLGGHGEVLVVDWGIAKVLGRDELGKTQGVVHLRDGDALSLTREGSAMGTLYYMPPEQARGELSAIDARSDVYSLGATLYELLTLKRPVTGGSAADIIAKVVNGEITPIREAKPDLHEDLAAVVMKALAFNPDRRYARCSDFADDIRNHLAGLAVVARRRNVVERIGAFIARNKKQVAIGAGLTAFAIACAAVTVSWMRAKDEAAWDAGVVKARAAAEASRWQESYDAATWVGDNRPEAVELRVHAFAALEAEKKQREDTARNEANRAKAMQLTAEARDAAATRNWQLSSDRAKAALAIIPVDEAQELLARASAALTETRRIELERLAAERKAAGDTALTAAKALPPLDPAFAPKLAEARAAYAKSAADGVAAPGIESALSDAAKLQEQADTARAADARAAQARDEAAKRRAQAEAAIVAAVAALDAGQPDTAAEQIAIARKLQPDDERANELRDRIALQLRDRDAARNAAAARTQARTTAAAALVKARAAESAMRAALADVAARDSEAKRLELELKTQPLERKAALVAARDAAQGARARVAEQWALGEGSARTAFDALSGEPSHADAVAARDLLISLYRGRLDDARRNAALPEAAAFGNLLRRLGVDVDAPETGTLTIDGTTATLTVRRLAEDGNGRLVARDPPLPSLAAGLPLTLPQGRYEIRAGDELASVVIAPGSNQRFSWAPAKRPQIPLMRLRWVPATAGFWLAEDEVTQASYAEFLKDPAVFAQAQRSYAAFMDHSRNDLELLPREGTSPDDLNWAPVDADGKLNSMALQTTADARQPVRGVSRLDAEAFCRWLSAKTGQKIRLPSASERLSAASGGDNRRLYPWGPGFDFALASTALPKKTVPPAVGSSVTDLGPFGHRDLAGSVREWVSDPGLAHPGTIAGGAYTDDMRGVFRCDYVESTPPTSAFSAIGFRILVEP